MAGEVHPHVQRFEPGQPFWRRSEDPQSGRSATSHLRRALRPLRRHGRQFLYRVVLRYRYYVLRHRAAKQLLVIAEGRTGSNLLVSYLGSVPGIAVTEEVLNKDSRIGLRRRWLTKGASLRHIAYSLAMPSEVAVVKLPPHQLRWHAITYGELCRRYSSARFAIVTRRNLAKQYISWCRLYLTGQERARADKPAPNCQICVDADHFIEFCRRMRTTYHAVFNDDALQSRSVVIAYEDFAAEAQRVFDDLIFPLLQIAPVPVRTQMRRQNTRSLEESISNFAALQTYLESPEATLDHRSESAAAADALKLGPCQ